MSNQSILNNTFVRKNLSLAWPIALNALLMQSMLIIDTLLVSPLGEIPLAAIGIASTLIAFILGVQFALSNGTQMLVARVFGADNQQGLSMALTTGLVINLLTAIVFLVALLTVGDQLIALLTNDSKLEKQVRSYLSISQFIILITACTQVFTAYFNGIGKTIIPLRGYILELPFNAIVSYFLIFGWQLPNTAIFQFNYMNYQGMGLKGAAMGSLIAVSLRFGFLLWQLIKLDFLKVINNKKQTFLTECKRHLYEIFPIAINFIILSIGSTVYQLLFAQLNIYSFVAVTLIFPWIRIGTQFITSWAQATAINISQAIGKQQTNLIKPIINSSIAVGFIVSVIIALSFYFLSLSVSYIYPQVQNATYDALASIAPLYILLPIVRTFNTISGHTLRALGKSISVLKIHFFTQWFIVLPSCALIIFYFKLPLFWGFSMLIFEEIIKAIPFYIMLNKVRK